MADDRDDSQKTEEPTQRRLQEAADSGDLVKSQEVQTLALLLGGTLAIAMFGRWTTVKLAETMRLFIEQPDQIATDGGALILLMRDILIHLAMALGPFVGLLMLAGVAGNLLQHRPHFAFDRIKPDISKLSLLSGFKRMFGVEGVSNLLKGLVKIAIVGAAIWTQLWPERGLMGTVLEQAPAAVAGDIAHLVYRILIATLAALAVIAVLDYLLQRHRFYQRNRMTKQEVKEEHRQSEGDPLVKAKIRQVRIERSRRRMIAAVPQATVVITNPTHFAVALKYEAGEMAAPVCVAKGVDALALKIREVAAAHKVPVVENPPLARALYAAIEVDEAIPPEHYKAVAQVIGYVMKLAGKIRR